jgi:hypothetical protein
MLEVHDITLPVGRCTACAPRGDPRTVDLYSVFSGKEAVLRAELDCGKAIVVDSRGHCSQQMDLVIYDRHFSPQWWERADHHYIPAESLYAAFEVKPEINRDYLLYASDKIASVRQLHRKATTFAWAQGTMNPLQGQPPILGGFLASASSWSPTFGEPFRKALADGAADGALDLGCVLSHGAFEIPNNSRRADAITSAPEVSPVTFLLTVLRRLQGLPTVPAIDYLAYQRWITDNQPGEVKPGA